MTETNQRAVPQLLPWHEDAAAQLRKAWAANRLSHALLLQGAEGVGKQTFAAWLACAVLCDKSTGSTLRCCGECASCALFAAGSHPDLILVIPEEDKQQISIDQVRAATERLTKTSYRQGYKVAIVDPAHLMTPSAANSVLKTLEEPSARSLLLLITSQPSMLLPTVRSRCQKVTIARPSRDEAIAWLREKSGRAIEAALLDFAGGAPLRALAYADGRFHALSERLTWLDLWLSSLARAALAGTADLVTFPGRSTHLPSPSRPLNISGVYSMVDRARALKAQLARTALQRELAVESWLIALMDVLELNRKRA
jgi:DNA polymerase-3 subunit delta'